VGNAKDDWRVFLDYHVIGPYHFQSLFLLYVRCLLTDCLLFRFSTSHRSTFFLSSIDHTQAKEQHLPTHGLHTTAAIKMNAHTKEKEEEKDLEALLPSSSSSSSDNNNIIVNTSDEPKWTDEQKTKALKSTKTLYGLALALSSILGGILSIVLLIQSAKNQNFLGTRLAPLVYLALGWPIILMARLYVYFVGQVVTD
jgi:hypothetical protein